MWETTLAIMAAMLTIFIAGLLVKKQRRCHEHEQELKKKVEDGLESIANEVEILTGGEPVDASLIYLEKRIKKLNDSIALTRAISYRDPESERGRIKRGKGKKYFAND